MVVAREHIGTLLPPSLTRGERRLDLEIFFAASMVRELKDSVIEWEQAVIELLREKDRLSQGAVPAISFDRIRTDSCYPRTNSTTAGRSS